MREQDSPAPDEARAAPTAEPQAMSLFAPAAFFGERKVKTGETVTLTVKAVDPESGEAELTLASAAPEEAESEGALPEMDKQFPAESEEE